MLENTLNQLVNHHHVDIVSCNVPKLDDYLNYLLLGQPWAEQHLFGHKVEWHCGTYYLGMHSFDMRSVRESWTDYSVVRSVDGIVRYYTMSLYQRPTHIVQAIESRLCHLELLEIDQDMLVYRQR